MRKFVILLLAFFMFGCIDNNLSNISSSVNELISGPSTFYLNGIVTNINNKSLENVKIVLFNSTVRYESRTDKNGMYSFSKIPSGTYSLALYKDGYKNYSYPPIYYYVGNYSLDFMLVKDCLYYPIDKYRNYVLRYGYNGTIYRTKINCTLEYPENSSLYIFPDITDSQAFYIGDNRMLRFELNNIDNRYSYIEFRFIVNTSGKEEIVIKNPKEYSISKAAAEQSVYLGERSWYDSKRGSVKFIDPNNPEIKEIVEEVMKRTNSSDSWTIAKELFIWLKNNTEYFNIGGIGLGEYVQSPAELLKSRKGDCDELSYLYISLLRAANIPSRFVIGYLATNSSTFSKHMWVEFYAGEWIPVEVAGTGDLADEINMFGVLTNSHVPIFIDDGTSRSMMTGGCNYEYFGKLPSVSQYIYYDSVSYSPAYIAVCSDGERYLTELKE